MSKNKDFEGLSIYQVYPRSFFDSNNDGIGDLPGITAKLEYIADLGIDYLWISPFYTSPMKDFGYDVSNYNDVDPIFGNLADFKALVKKADKLGVKLMLDMVLAHSSDQHPWFIEAAKSKTNPKHDWYIWADAPDPKKPPNNWLSLFGGSAWTYNKACGQFYLHKFLNSQPNLNFFNPEVEKALLDVCKFWLELGVKGFRFDTVNFFYHDQKLRSNPLLEVKKIGAGDVPDLNPYSDQRHIYDKNQPENVEFLKKVRKLTDKYGAITLGEVGDNQKSNEIIKEYTAGTDRLHLCYGFDYMGAKWDASAFAKIIDDFWKQAPLSMICNSFGNHDSTRFLSRWAHHKPDSDAFAKLCSAILLCLKGTVGIYQGEELGLTEYAIKKDELVDPYGLAFYPKFKGRDGCRTPFVWEKDGLQGGFSKAKKTWLPVAPEHLPKAVDQMGGTDTLLNFYKKLLKFKKTQPALLYGKILASTPNKETLLITRDHGADKVQCLFNFSATKHSLDKLGVKIDDSKILFSNSYKAGVLSAYGFCIFK